MPETLDADPWGYPMARDRSREPEVPAELAGYAREAVRLCPRLALRLRE
ncbi:ferredoxin [Amycolatopsis acididurans]|nr:ferredoxin [Amycolatopsis acididurans]